MYPIVINLEHQLNKNFNFLVRLKNRLFQNSLDRHVGTQDRGGGALLLSSDIFLKFTYIKN